MIDLSPVQALLIMLGSLLFLLMLGVPVVFAMGGLGVLGLVLTSGVRAWAILPLGALAVMDWYTLIAATMFIFMAVILQGAGVIEDLFQAMRLWFAGVRGGLAVAVVAISTIVAAMSGSIATGVLTLGITALPVMLKLGYNKSIALGPMIAGAGLAFLIPPSIGFIIYGALAEASIGRLFLGGIIPGLMLASMYGIYALIMCLLKPQWGPALPVEERVGLRRKIVSLKTLILPVLLVLGVLAPIFLGIASPTESSAVGAAGAIACAAINRKLNWSLIKVALDRTFKTTIMLTWIMIGVFGYKAVLIKMGSTTFVAQAVASLQVDPIVIIYAMMLSYLFLGMFMEETAALMITLPVYLPILGALGFDLVWFGVLVIVNWQVAVVSPPYAFAHFYMMSVAPKGVTLADCYRSVLPYIPMQIAVMILVMHFPQLALWVPNRFLG